MMKTFVAKPKVIKCDWYVVDATGKTLGRLASEIAKRLRGKHKVEYTPHISVGDYIIVVNAKKISITGNKGVTKRYYRHTGHVGNIKKVTFSEMFAKHPERIIKMAVKGMLPKGSLGRIMYRKLRVYEGEKHNHVAQNPKILCL